MYQIRLIPREEMETILPFLQLLDASISKETLAERLTEMFNNNYKCVGIFDNDKLIGVSGLWILTKYYIGKHIEPDNVIIAPEYQNKKIGNMLVEWIHDYGKKNGCVASELNCYITNPKGQKFWVNQGYEIKAFHYRKTF